MDNLLWTSELNHCDEVRNQLKKMKKKIKIYDTTLRDGEQTIGVALSSEEKLNIAKKLEEIGVDRIEAGFPTSSETDKKAIKNIVDSVKDSEVWGFARCNVNDIKMNIDLGIKNMVCEILTSPQKMKAWNLSEDTVLERIRTAITYAKEQNIYTAFFAVDATRADLKFLKKCYQTAVNECGADEVVVVDTLGVASPESMGHLTKLVKSWVNVPIAVHCHNDFGLGVACTIAALKEGADSAHVTINGLGEKTGNADVAALAIALKGLYDVETNLKLDKLYGASKLVESLTNMPVSPMAPVVGDLVFTRESGLVVAQMLSYPPSVEGYSPELVGRERKVSLGKKSGKKSIEYALKNMSKSHSYDEDNIIEILKLVKEESVRLKRSLTDDEFKILANKYFS